MRGLEVTVLSFKASTEALILADSSVESWTWSRIWPCALTLWIVPSVLRRLKPCPDRSLLRLFMRARVFRVDCFFFFWMWLVSCYWMFGGVGPGTLGCRLPTAEAFPSVTASATNVKIAAFILTSCERERE